MARGSAVPPVRLVLPVNAGPRRGLLALAATHAGLVGALGLVGPIIFIASPPTIRSASDLVFLALIWLILAPMGIVFTGAAITCLRDLARPSPVLTLTAEGIWDRRLLDRLLPWPEVARATLTYAAGSPRGVLLELRHAVVARQNPFP